MSELIMVRYVGTCRISRLEIHLRHEIKERIKEKYQATKPVLTLVKVSQVTPRVVCP